MSRRPSVVFSAWGVVFAVLCGAHLSLVIIFACMADFPRLAISGIAAVTMMAMVIRNRTGQEP